jgi:hypothetical protein
MLNGHTGVIYHFYKLQLCYYLNLITRQNNKSLNISYPLSYAAFIGFLRCGQFTILNQLDLEYKLCFNDLQITDRCIFRQGIRILLDKTGYASYPVFR